MHRLRPTLAAALVVGALVVRTQLGPDVGAAELAADAVASTHRDAPEAGSASPARDEVVAHPASPTASPPLPTVPSAEPTSPSASPIPAELDPTTATAPTTDAPVAAPTPASPPVVATAPISTSTSALPPPSVGAVSDAQAGLLQLVNGERAKAGLAPLPLGGRATTVAQGWTVTMAASSLGHNPDLVSDLERAGATGWHTVGENVGNAACAEEVLSLFMASAVHRANILSSTFSRVGIGTVTSGGLVWVTMDFID